MLEKARKGKSPKADPVLKLNYLSDLLLERFPHTYKFSINLFEV